ncbi:LysR family transcriptional regulator [Inquilinus limosus]|uniref:LysR family transcriptional regulator n=1 Tax=Inquilinus limosus TaxID=171674 RepID=UPI0004051305|nr:LysR family transcriptional regulator [Inquilinus limosus]
MNIRFLETAIWLSRLRSFRATAERLNITQAAISSRVAAMEQELGFKLFERDARDVRPTAEGQTFVEGAQEIVARYHELVCSLDPTSAIKGAVRIGLVPSMALTLLPDIAGTLRRQFPNVRFSVTTDASHTILQKLSDREIDVALIIRPDEADGLKILDLCTFGMFWISGPALLPHSADGTLGPEDIAAHAIISYEPGAHNHARLVEYLAGAGDPVLHYSNSLATTVSMTIAGIGIAVLPPVVIQRELREGILHVLKVHPPFPATRYAAVHLDPPMSRLPGLVASIARDAAAAFCCLYDASLAHQG